MPRRRICVVTGSRADYGLLRWLMEEIRDDPVLELQVIATGMHLSPEFGLTYRAIEEDGLVIDAKVEMLLSSDTPVGIAKSVGLGVIGFADALDRLRPDMLVVLGDRFEILAAAQAALFARVPIAHLHGGESTEGAVDESIRHALTKMASLHFVAAEPYRKRVVQLGENPAHVFDFGAPGLDSVRRLKLLDREELERAIGFSLGPVSFLVTYHPATLGDASPSDAASELLKALDHFPDARLVFTMPNADAGGKAIAGLIEKYVQAHPGRATAVASLGQLRYLSTLAHVDAVVGNSSSGIIEAPLFRKPTVNIGPRQSGRLKADSIIDCEEKEQPIVAAIRQALSAGTKDRLKDVRSLYGTGDSSSRIKEALKTVRLEGILLKRFRDQA